MIKKHLIGCSGLLIMMLFAKLFVNNTPEPRLNTFSKRVALPFEQTFSDKETTSPIAEVKSSRLTFSNEKLPKGRAIAARMRKYLKANSYERIQTTKLHQKAARWFPVIEPILKAYGIPEDFKYVPLVESGLAEGTSPRGAAGYWQFMPATARSYGLKVNAYVDERKNMRKSTIAACKYLKELHGIFKSWTLAAAAYNVGEIKLLRQMSRQGHRNYYKLQLNKETASYVYKLIAMKEIIENPVKHGFVKRGGELLAQKEENGPRRYFLDPRVEREAVKALSILQN